EDAKIFPSSAISRQGVSNLLFEMADRPVVTAEFPMIEEEADESESTVLYKHESDSDGFEITRDPDGAFVISGYAIERLFKMTDFSREDAIRRFARQMRGTGIDDALRERGAEDGDTV